jgi:hypothetical protein
METRDPQAGEVLIALKAAGVNPLDTYIREGPFSASFPNQKPRAERKKKAASYRHTNMRGFSFVVLAMAFPPLRAQKGS